jgi:hypothetical protein
MKGYVHLGCSITYNVGNPSDDKVESDLMTLIRAHRPLLLHLQETWDRKGVIRRVAERTGYVALIPEGSAAHCITLVHPEVIVDGWGTMRLSERTWVGRKVAGARRHGMARKNDAVWVRYRHAGTKFIDANVHLVPSHSVDLACRLAKLQAGILTAWLWTRRRIASVTGDVNETINAGCDSMGPLEKIGEVYTAPSHGTRAIDWWIMLKRQTKRFNYIVEALTGYNSDHRPVKKDIYRKMSR